MKYIIIKILALAQIPSKSLHELYVSTVRRGINVSTTR